MKNDTKTIGLLLIVLSITIIALGIVLWVQEPKNESNVKYENNDEQEEIIQDNNKGESVYNLLKDYSGIYSNENMEIHLFMPTDYYISFSLITDNSYIGGSLEIDEAGNLVYNETFGEIASIKIIKMNEGIEVIATSDLTESIYNLASGTYSKKEFTSKNWSGVYQKDDVEIRIDEYGPNNIYLLITRGYTVFGLVASNYDETLIYKEENISTIKNIISITKTETGIKIEASSTDRESLLNEITGEYSNK